MPKNILGIIHPMDNPNKSKRIRVEQIKEVEGRYFRIIHLEQEIYPEEIDGEILSLEKKIANDEYELSNQKNKLEELKRIKKDNDNKQS